MSKKNYQDDEERTFAIEAPPVVSRPVSVGPVSGEIFVENLMTIPIDITLLDGTNLNLAPWRQGGGGGKSRVVPKKLIPSYAKRLAKNGEIRFVDAGGVK